MQPFEVIAVRSLRKSYATAAAAALGHRLRVFLHIVGPRRGDITCPYVAAEKYVLKLLAGQQAGGH